MNVTIRFTDATEKTKLSELIYNFLTTEGFNSIRNEASTIGDEDTIIVMEPVQNLNKETN